MIKPLFIFDLDGTISLCDHRLKYIQVEKIDWDTFFKECINDKVNEFIAFLMRNLWYDYKIIVISGRSEDVRKQTLDWFRSSRSSNIMCV